MSVTSTGGNAISERVRRGDNSLLKMPGSASEAQNPSPADGAGEEALLVR
jgi:hypothetical protein